MSMRSPSLTLGKPPPTDSDDFFSFFQTGRGGGAFSIQNISVFLGVFFREKKRQIISKIGRGGAVRLAVCVP